MAEPDRTRRRRSLLVSIVAIFVVVMVGGAAVMLLNRSNDSGTPATTTAPSRAGGRLRVAISGLQSLDPAKAHDPASVMVADLLFDTLVTYDPDTLAVKPQIAASWEASVDQRKFTFVLRPDATFDDGSRITATDVKATLERIAAPSSTTDLRWLLESVNGYAEFHDSKKATELTGVKVVDDHTVSIELTQPFSEFPRVLANPGFGIVPAAHVDDKGFADHPIGSGPLQFAGRTGDVIRLDRNDAYQPRPAHVDGVEVHLVTSPDEGYSQLQHGEVDLAPVPADQVNEARAKYGPAGLGPFMGVLFYGMNLQTPDLQDPRLRQAILHAVDRQRIIDVVYGGTLTLAHGFVPAAGVPGAVADACGDRCAHDPAEAHRLVREAFPDGNVPTITVDFDDDPKQEAVAKSIKSDLEDAGIPTELRPHAFKDYGLFLVNDEPELFRLGWTADYLSPDAYLFPLFVSGQRDNLVRMSNPQIDQILRAARAEPDPEKRTSLYHQAEQAVLDQYPVVPIAQYTNRWAVAKSVQGFTMTPLGTFDVTQVRLERSGATAG